MASTLAQSAVAASVVALSQQKLSFLAGSQSARSAGLGVSNGSRVSMAANWLPGNPRPAHLDGSLPGDFGFDPFGFGEVPSNLDRFTESELIHSRWAMLGTAGVLIPDAIGLGDWVEAQKWASTPGGVPTYFGQELPWGTLPAILAINGVAIAFAEAQRVDNADPVTRKYPGGAFDPLGFAKDPSKLAELKLKEIKNGRLAMVSFLGYAVQAAVYPGTGPLDNLAAHLADPFHANISDIIIVPIL